MNKKFKESYINAIDSTSICIKEPKYKEDIIVSFIDGAKVEIIGNTNNQYKVEFFDKDNKLYYKTNIVCNMWTKTKRKYFENWLIKISYNNKVKIFKFNCSNKIVFIKINSKSLGDNIAWIPFIEEFRIKNNCKVIASTFFNSLFISTYKDIEFTDDISNKDIYASYTLGCFFSSDKEPELPNTIPLQKVASNILGLNHKEIKANISFDKIDININNYIAIAPYSTAQLKQWNNKGWVEVVNYLVNNGYNIINISNRKINIKNVIELSSIDKEMSLNTIINIINGSKFMIGLSSGLSWLSWSLNKHVVLIANFTNEEHEFKSNCSRIINKEVCNSCWNKKEFRFDKNDFFWCPLFKNTERQFECHNSITSNDVINEIKKIN